MLMKPKDKQVTTMAAAMPRDLMMVGEATYPRLDHEDYTEGRPVLSEGLRGTDGAQLCRSEVCMQHLFGKKSTKKTRKMTNTLHHGDKSSPSQPMSTSAELPPPNLWDGALLSLI